MVLSYVITDDKKTIYISHGYIEYLYEIQNVIVDNQIKILYYESQIDIGTNFDFPNNPIEEIIYTTPRFSKYCDKFQKQNLNNLPEKLQILKFNLMDIECYKFDNLPSGLKKLSLPNSYCYELDNLPLELEYLSLYVNNSFTQSLSYLPESLKELIISQKNDNNVMEYYKFNNLASLLKEFKEFEYENNSYTQSFSYLPMSLKKLKIISHINDNMVNINCDHLPNKLEKIFLCGNINSEFNNLPRNLKILHLTQFNNIMIHNLPDGIEELKIPINYKYLKEIFSSTNTVKFKKLKKLIIGFNLKSHSRSSSLFDLESIPDFVEEIVFGDNFNQKITYLPQGVKKITFGFNYNYSIGSGDLPDSIEHLEFGYNFNKTIDKYPSNLKILKFNSNYLSSVENLPDGLLELEINVRFKDMLSKLPTTLVIIRYNKFAENHNLDNFALFDYMRILQFDSMRILQYDKYQKLRGTTSSAKLDIY